MKRLLVAVLLCCGRTEPFDAREPPAPPPPDAGPMKLPLTCRGDCKQRSFDQSTYASCSVRAECDHLSGEGYVCYSDGGCARVLALRDFGRGRVLAYGDSTSLGDLFTRQNLPAVLSAKAAPRIASFGDTFICRESIGYPPLPDGVRYLGMQLPATWPDGRALARDWDVLVWCGWRNDGPDAGPAPGLFAEYVSEGGGLIAVFDYQDADNPSLRWANRLLEPFELSFEVNRLDWGTLKGCVP